MEKLVVKFEVGDGYTYSAQAILPAIFSSKEEFIISFEDTLIQRSKLVEEIRSQWMKNSDQLKAALKSKKNADEIKELMMKGGELTKKETDFKTFVLGGQSFYLEDFLKTDYSEEGTKTEQTFQLPEVLTVDEWFKEVGVGS